MAATDARVGPRSPSTETLPEGWKSAFDPGYNRKYYFDRHGTVQWELPTAPVLHEELSPVTPGRAQERGQSMQQAAGSTEVAGVRSPVAGPQSRAADVPVLPTPLPRSRLADVPVFPTRATERRRANSGVTQVFTNAHLADADLAAKRIQEIFQRKHRSRVQRLKTAGAQRAREVRDAVRMQLAERQARLAERQVSQSDGSPEATPATSPTRRRPPAASPPYAAAYSGAPAAAISGASPAISGASPAISGAISASSRPPSRASDGSPSPCHPSCRPTDRASDVSLPPPPSPLLGGHASPPSALPTVAADYQSVEGLQRHVQALSMQLAEAQASLRAERRQSAQWERCVRELSNGLFLNARMNAKYEQRVASRLAAALSRLDHVGSVRYINCSFPSVAADAPRMKLLEYTSLESSRWGVTFSPRWTVELCLEGTSFLVPFKLVLRLRGLSLRGELAASFPPNLAYAVICFREFPEVRFEVDADVSMGTVPMPLQSAISNKIRAELHKWVASRVVAPRAMRINRKLDGAPKDQPTLQRVVLNGGDISEGGSGYQLLHAERSSSPTQGGDAAGDAAGAPAGAPPEPQSPTVTDEQLQQAILAAAKAASRSVREASSQPSRPRAARRR